MNRSWLASFLMYLWLTIGFAILHHLIVLWGIALISFISPDPGGSEVLQITESGEPVVQIYANRNRDVSFRRTDGTRIVDTLGIQKSFVSGESLADFEPGTPLRWEGRIESFHDFQKPATSWYLIAEPNRNRTAYFVGYEPLSRRLVGYLGTRGFTVTRPSVSESFPVQQPQYGSFYGSLVASQKLYNYAVTFEPPGEYLENNYVPLDNVEPDLVWLLSAGTLYEIHLRDRSIRTVFVNRPDLKNVIRSTIKHGDKTSLQLVCRNEQELVLIEPKSREITSLPLASAPAGTMESMYQLSDNRKVFTYTPRRNVMDHPENHRIIWVNSEGRIERELETKLQNINSSDANLQRLAGLICPAPIVSLSAWMIAPFVMEHDTAEKQTYFGRFSEFGRMFFSWLVVSVIVGFISGWACRRREYDVFHNSNWFWPILVGISGWFGWVGYAFLKPLPARLPNGSWLPRQPEPAQPIGTEIFA